MHYGTDEEAEANHQSHHCESESQERGGEGRRELNDILPNYNLHKNTVIKHPPLVNTEPEKSLSCRMFNHFKKIRL